MNTKELAAKYRLSHWAQVMRERQESGLSIRAFCKNAGFHENVYFYWQRKLREASCEQLAEVPLPVRKTGMIVPGFTEVQLAKPSPSEYRELASAVSGGQIHIEVGEVRISADSGYSSEKLVTLLRELMRLC